MLQHELSSDELSQSSINSILASHDIGVIEELPQEIETRKQEIEKLESQGKKSTAVKRKESLAELEKLQELLNRIKVEKTATSSGSNYSLVTQEILDRLSSHDIEKIEDLPVEIEIRKQHIKELEAQGKKSTAAKRKKSLEELEDIQKLVSKDEVVSSITINDNDQILEKLPSEEICLVASSKKETNFMNEISGAVVAEAKDLETDQKTIAATNNQKDITCRELSDPVISAEYEIQQSGNVEVNSTIVNNAEQPELTVTAEDILGTDDSQEQQKTSLAERTSFEPGIGNCLDTKEEAKDLLKEDSTSCSFVTDIKKEQNQTLVSPKIVDDTSNTALLDLLSVPEISDRIIQEESIEARKYNELYKKYKHVLTNMPDCAEKSLSILWIHFESEQFRIKLTSTVESFLTIGDINVVFNKLKTQLQIEGLKDRFVRQTMEKIEVQFADKNYDPNQAKELSDDFFQILKQIQPVDLDLMLHYIDKAISEAEKIKNKDILLLLGGTGTGKSTTIHFLAGSKMEKRKVSGLTHISPVTVKNPDLISFSTSPFLRSETRSINAITINASELGAKQATEITLCDSPGFGDTDGVELDIANGIGVVRAVKGSRSVKPIILVSQKSIGDRSGGLTALANILVMFIPDIKQQLGAFTYIFTKYKKEDSSEIQHTLMHKETALTREEKANIGFVELLRDMIEKTKREVIILDPINDNPGELIDILYDRPAIMNPKENFHDFATTDSLAKLKEQLYKHKISIERALEQVNIPLLVYKIDQMARTNKNLIINDSQRIYERSIDGLVDLIQNLESQANGRLSICMNTGNTNVDSDIWLSCQKIFDLYQLEGVRKNYLPKLSNLEEKCSLLVGRCQEELKERITLICHSETTISSETLFNALIDLNKLKLLLVAFSDTFAHLKSKPSFIQLLQAGYFEACQSLYNLYDAHLNKAKNALLKSDFVEYVSSMDILSLMANKYKEHLNSQQLDSKYQEIVDNFSLILTQLLENINSLLMINQSSIDVIDLESIKKSFFTISVARTTYGIEHHANQNSITLVIKKMEQIIIDFAEKVCGKIVQEVCSNNLVENFIVLYNVVQKLDALRANSQIQHVMSKPYQDIIKNIKTYVTELKRGAQQYLGWLNESALGIELPIDYSIVTTGMIGLKNASIFSGHMEGIYEDDFEELKKIFVEFMHRVGVKLSSFSLSLESISSLKIVLELSKQLNNLQNVEKIALGDVNQSAKYLMYFNDQIVEILSDIKSLFVKDSFLQDSTKIIKSFDFIWYCCMHGACQYSELLYELISNINQEIQKCFKQLQTDLEEIYEHVFIKLDLDESILQQQALHVVNNLIMLAELRSVYSSYNLKEKEELLKIKEEDCTSSYAYDLCKQLLSLSKKLFETHTSTILNDWILGTSSKIYNHQLLLMEDVKNTESGQPVNMVYIKLMIINQLKIIDKLISEEINYTNIASNLEIALRSQKLSKINELTLLASTEKYDEFQKVYTKTIETTPDLKEELNIPVETLYNSVARQTTELLKKTSSFVFDETTTESAQVILEGFSNIKRAAKVVIALLPTTNAELVSSIDNLEGNIKQKLAFYNQTIVKFIEDNRFNKVEGCFKVLKTICDFCKSSDLLEACNLFIKLIDNQIVDGSQKKLKEVLEQKMSFYLNLDFIEYAKSPPIIFINQLQEVNESDNPIYRDNQEKLIRSITKKITDVLANITIESTSVDDHKTIKLIVELAPYLPSDLHATYMEQLKAAKELFDQKEEKLKRMLEESASVDKLRSLVDKIEELSRQKNYQHAYQVSTWINSLIKDTANRFKSDLDKGDLAIVIESLPASWDDWWYYKEKLCQLSRQVIPEHVHYFSSEFVGSVINDMVNRITGTISEVINIIQSNSLVNLKSSYRLIQMHFDKFKAFLNLLDQYHSFKKKTPEYLHFYDDLQKILPNLTEGLLQSIDKIIGFLLNNQKKFIDGVQSSNIIKLREILDVAEEYATLIDNINSYLTGDAAERMVPDLRKSMLTSISYSDMCQSLSEQLILLKEKVKVALLHNPILSTTSQNERDSFYKELSHVYLNVTSAKLIARHVDEKIIDLKSIEVECKSHVIQELTKIKEELLTNISRFPSEDKAAYFDFNIWLDNLRSFKDYFSESSLAQEASSILKTVERAFEDRAKMLRDSTGILSRIDDIAEQLISFKCMAILIPCYHKKITQEIDAALVILSKSDNGEQKIATLGLTLRQVEGDNQDPAVRLINEHAAFKSYAISIRNQKTLRYTYSDVLKDLKGDGINSKQLESAVVKHDELYWDLVENGLVKVEEAKKQIIQKAKQTSISPDDLVTKIVKLSAHLFAYWTLDNSTNYKDMLDVVESSGIIGNQKNYLLQPHSAQVISIFRLLGIDTNQHKQFDNHLVQIGTGEGKSVTLAITASILALLGYDVDCACYSEYLSCRDYDAFANLFEALQITDYIHYGTFNRLCEDFINYQSDIRELVLSYISQDSNKINLTKGKRGSGRNKILLIDEVDVFFSQDFYGNFYRPLAELSEETISTLIQHIWSNRYDKDALSFSSVKASKEFIECCSKFVGWEFLIEEATKEMLSDIKTFEEHEYVVLRDRIGYKDQDGISFNISYGFKTLFAYFKEHAAGNITQSSRDAHLAFTIDLGIYSYAEIPRQYKCIMGVTGTLATLSQSEKDILKSYGIEKSTFMPSVYGNNQLVFASNTIEDLKIESTAGYFASIANEIKKRLERDSKGSSVVVKRAILVFFRTKAILDQFYESTVLSDLGIKEKIKLITEHVSKDEKEGLIAQAMTTGSITLLTAEFGRGTDFKCYDDRINNSGGVHVIQTFVSDSLSEETQIKGRTARQGNVGSYSMVLLESELERYDITSADVAKMKSTNSLYDTINYKRIAFFEKQFPENIRQVDQIREEHLLSEKFLDAIHSEDIAAIKAFLKSRNQGQSKRFSKSSDVFLKRTICLMDATGSMHGLLTKAKNTVHAMFERACAILKEKGMAATFELQFVVYRNYDCKEERILQYSGWESDPNNLRQFMNTIDASGGTWEPEAIEIGLWHANHVAETVKINQVILIGDAPPNPRELVNKGRQEYLGESYWETTKFSNSTYVDDEVEKLKQKGIPVHAFYVKNSAKASFEKIAITTNGHHGMLDIDSPEGAEKLTQVVTERILEDLGGVELVELYRAKYVRGYLALEKKSSVLVFSKQANDVREQSITEGLNLDANSAVSGATNTATIKPSLLY